MAADERTCLPEPPFDPTAWMKSVERRIRAVSERGMRRALLTEMLAELTAPALVAGLAYLQQRARGGQGLSREVLQEIALGRTVLEGVPYHVRQQAYALAQRSDLQGVAAMLLTSTENPNPTVAEADTGNNYASESVGQRCTNARGRDRNKLDRLTHDKDKRVIAILLDNPRLVERDVIKIAAMRPTRADVLEVVARHRRWASRYRVRKALACNPHTPLPISRRLIPTLLQQDLVTVKQAGGIRPEIRAQAARLLERA